MQKFVKATAAFSGQDLNYSGDILEGAKLNAIFGGLEIDLSKAIIPKDITIIANVAFGGMDILLPENVRAEVKSCCAFGGVSNMHINQQFADAKVYIKVMCAFGGVDIR